MFCGSRGLLETCLGDLGGLLWIHGGLFGLLRVLWCGFGFLVKLLLDLTDVGYKNVNFFPIWYFDFPNRIHSFGIFHCFLIHSFGI